MTFQHIIPILLAFFLLVDRLTARSRSKSRTVRGDSTGGNRSTDSNDKGDDDDDESFRTSVIIVGVVIVVVVLGCYICRRWKKKHIGGI